MTRSEPGGPTLSRPLAESLRWGSLTVAALFSAAAVFAAVVMPYRFWDSLWRDLLDLGRSGWTHRAEMENFAYGPFSYELSAARENVDRGDRIVSSDGRLAYFFPGQVEVAYATSCLELDGARFFSFLTSGESLEFARLAGQPIEPIGWLDAESRR